MASAPPPRRRRRRARRQLPPWLGPTVGGVLVVGALIGIGLVVAHSLHSRWDDIAEYLDPGNKVDLSYLPPDADCLIVLRGTALRRADPVKAFIDSARYQQEIAPSWELIGIPPENVETATFGAVGFGRQLDGIVSGHAGAAEFVTVVRTSEPVDPAAQVLEPFSNPEPVDHAGRSYTRVRSGEDATSRVFGIFAADATTIVFGSEPQIRAALERLEQGVPVPRRTDLDFMNPDHHLTVVVISAPDAQRSSPEVAAAIRLLPPDFTALIETVDEVPEQFALGLTYEDQEIEIEARCRMTDADRQAAFQTRIEEVVATSLERLREQRLARSGQAGSDPRWVLEATAEEAFREVTINPSQGTVVVATTVPVGFLTDRDRLRVHTMSMLPFNLVLEQTPRLMLGLKTIAEDEDD